MSHDFTLTRVDRARIRLRTQELDWRTKELKSKIQRHERDPDYRHSLIDWRKELLEARVEQMTGIAGYLSENDFKKSA
jgi:hypothetical protein